MVACEDENPRSGFDKLASGERRTLERSDDGPEAIAKGRVAQAASIPANTLGNALPTFHNLT